MVGAEQLRELREGSEPPVEVRSQRDRYDGTALWIRRGVHQRIHERCALTLVGARRKQLLELVDREQQALVRRKRRIRRKQQRLRG